MTALTIDLSVTGLAQHLLLHRVRSVMLHEVSFMTQERLRQHAPHVCQRMTRRACSTLPLLFVFMAAETCAHRRQAWPPRFYDTRVARSALSEFAFQRQMPIMIECDDAVRALDGRGDRGAQSIGVVAMTARASSHQR